MRDYFLSIAPYSMWLIAVALVAAIMSFVWASRQRFFLIVYMVTLISFYLIIIGVSIVR